MQYSLFDLLIVRRVGLHGGECWITWWVVFGYIVKSVGLYGRVLGYNVESAGLHGGIGYMVECRITWWECWVTCWRDLSYTVGVLGLW